MLVTSVSWHASINISYIEIFNADRMNASYSTNHMDGTQTKSVYH